MIQAIMLIALGFLAASLIGVLLAPSLWNRAARLSKKKLESTLPLTLSEIEAAQDQLRASYAVRLRRLENALASAKQKAANQLVDNSRLQMQIGALKDQIDDLDMKLSERRNAATVLEQTITKRFPELDREITAVKTQLQERSFDLQDLTNKLSRRDEELAAAQRAAASYQDEIDRLRSAMEKGAGDRSGRRVRKASQWSLEDYKAEYDRLNLDMSRLRQQLAHFQDRDAQQVGVIKGELQKLAELILASAQPKAPPRPPEPRPDVFARRPSAYEPRKDRPAPWAPSGSPMPLTARLQLTAEAAETPPPPPAASVRDRSSDAEAGSIPLSSVLSILPEATVLTSAPKSRPAETGPRTKILRGVVAQEAVETPGLAEGARESAAPAALRTPAKKGSHPGAAILSASSDNTQQTAAPLAETVAVPAEAAAEQAAPAPEKEAASEGAPSSQDEALLQKAEPISLEDRQSPKGDVSTMDVKASHRVPNPPAAVAPPESEAGSRQDAQSADGAASATEVKAPYLAAPIEEAAAAPEMKVSRKKDAESDRGESEAAEARAHDCEALIADPGESVPAQEIEKARVAEGAAEAEAWTENGHAAPAPANGHAVDELEPGASSDITEASGAERLAADAPEKSAPAQPSSLLERLRTAEGSAEAKH
jgi:hypothetical protein